MGRENGVVCDERMMMMITTMGEGGGVWNGKFGWGVRDCVLGIPSFGTAHFTWSVATPNLFRSTVL